MASPVFLLLLTSIVCACAIGFTHADSHFQMKMSTNEYCTFPGYAPDGYKPQISSVGNVEVEAPASALAEMSEEAARSKICL